MASDYFLLSSVGDEAARTFEAEANSDLNSG